MSEKENIGKVCTDCKIKLPIIKFPIMNSKTRRRRSYCVTCWHEYMGIKNPQRLEWK